MTSKPRFEIGDIVRLGSPDMKGVTGIVSRPITEICEGHVLVFNEGFIQGVTVSLAEVSPADETAEGYAQLANNLVKLGSLVIEQGLI